MPFMLFLLLVLISKICRYNIKDGKYIFSVFFFPFVTELSSPFFPLFNFDVNTAKVLGTWELVVHGGEVNAKKNK